ncbi:hypothetical protein [Brevibacterium casei]|uniref:hypothetical protein n=1 Tax=Brevibacterium casei TaxID=33889 RepID=UPI003EE9B5DD
MVTVFSSKELRDLGFSDSRLRELLDCCAKQVRRGHFVLWEECANDEHAVLHDLHVETGRPYPQQFDDIRDNTEQLKILVRSYAGELLSDAVFSHISAAIIHGLDPAFPAASAMEIIRPNFHRVTTRCICHQRTLRDDEKDRVGDLPVTAMRRTLLDIAHDYPLETSVPLISQALREGRIDKSSLQNGIRPRTRGCAVARRAVELASPLYESAGEALCAVKFHRFGITGMVPQVGSYDANGSWIARNDFRHESLPLAVEFHGLGKYFLNEGGPDQASAKNHERHMKLLNSGLRVFNLVWGDLFRAQPFRQIKAELDALASSRPPLSAETDTSKRRSRR